MACKTGKNVYEFLSDLSEKVAPSQEFKSHANRVMEDISIKLKQHSMFSIDRLLPYGATKMKTSLSYSTDYELVAFMNNEKPPYTDVLEEFRDILLLNFDVTEEDIKHTNRSLIFRMEGIDFDLLPASNMTKPQYEGMNTWRKQRKAVLAEIREASDPMQAADVHSTGLLETAVEFVTQQSPFVLLVARLARFWNSTIICAETVFGRSYTFELLGIAAGRNEEEFKNKIGLKPSVSRAFRQFLKMVEDIAQQQIVFTFSEDFYSRSDTPDGILKQKPLILDPSNPYINVMSNFHGRYSVMKLFSDCAKESLERLDNFEREIEIGNDSSDLKEIFLPQPRPPCHPMRIPLMWTVGEQSGTPSLEPKVLIRNKIKVKQFQNALSGFLLASELEAKIENSSDKKASVKRSVQKCVNHLFGRDSGSTDCSTKDIQNNYDVTLEIPIGREGGETLVIGANWNLI